MAEDEGQGTGIHPHLRGDRSSRPLTEHEYNALYSRAMTGTRQEAADYGGVTDSSAQHSMSIILSKLGVDDIPGAYRAVGWLKPVSWNEYQERQIFVEDDDPRPYIPWP